MPQIDTLDKGQSQQRDSLSHQAIEDYVKTIYMLAQDESPVSTSRVAQARNVKPASATSMIQRLAKLNLVHYEKHYGVTLTDAGEKLALEVIRHHRLLELYLMEALGFRWDEVHEQADILEHVISEKLEERIAAALNHPAFDPHGDPIPGKDGLMAEKNTRLLSDVAAGQRVRVARIPDDSNSELLRYLAELGLVPGATIDVTAVAPFAGPLTLKFPTTGEMEAPTQVIGRNMAELILVELLPEDA
jgi:DtxR family transcriptional regulator, Mn-dependent transcriptional regulator